MTSSRHGRETDNARRKRFPVQWGPWHYHISVPGHSVIVSHYEYIYIYYVGIPVAIHPAW